VSGAGSPLRSMWPKRCRGTIVLRWTASGLALMAIAAGEPMPAINSEAFCRSAAVRAQPIASIDACMDDERRAHDQLIRQWKEFSAGDKADCVPLTLTGGTPTYIELLTCLELRRDTRRLRNGEDQDAGGLGGHR
jgi:hypothetical protein